LVSSPIVYQTIPGAVTFNFHGVWDKFLITRAVSGEQILLPIWHDITKQEVVEYSPSLADKVARNTAVYTIDEIADEIAEVIH